LSDSYLLDANILLRRIDETSDKQVVVIAAIERLAVQGARLCIVAQTLFEFWAVATRPIANNGIGLTTSQASQEVANIRAAFELLPETPLMDEWRRLVTTYGVTGKPTHDARYVAAMKVHQLDKVLTFNGSDFARFASGENISIIDPAKV